MKKTMSSADIVKSLRPLIKDAVFRAYAVELDVTELDPHADSQDQDLQREEDQKHAPVVLGCSVPMAIISKRITDFYSIHVKVAD